MSNCITTITLSEDTSKDRVRDYTEDCKLCADCFNNSDTTPAPGNGQGGSNPLGRVTVYGKRKCTEWKYTITRTVMIENTCGPCYKYAYEYRYAYFNLPECSAQCETSDNFNCPDGQYAGGYYNC